jgi:hypothetical protein
MNDVLVLVGMSGVGKSFWAERLATQRGYVRHDCDGAISTRLGSMVPVDEGEAPVHALGRWMGMPWSPGYAEREARYLALEAEVTAQALDAAIAPGRHVVDTTGSVIYLDPRLLARLCGLGRVVYLRTSDARREAMLRRYLEEPKPLVWGDAFTFGEGEAPEAALARCYAELLSFRDARYAALAHVTLDGGALEANDPGLDGFVSLSTR